MSKADRASQFMPFAALKGYKEALEAKEKIFVPKVELSEDTLAYLDYQIKLLTEGTMAEITYYSEGNYVKKSGIISKINKDARFLTMVKTDISFDDIKEISF